MKNIFTLMIMAFAITLVSCDCPVKSEEKKADLDLLVSFMEGAFSSEEQAQSDSAYFHITLDMKQIWNDRTDGAWLYVEQTAASTPGQPYRQRIYHLEQQTDTTFSSTICTFDNPKDYIGGHMTPEIFDGLTPDSIAVLEGCTLYLIYNDSTFAGQTIEGACKNSWGEATYATSEVTMTPDLLISWDRGWNNEKEHVWGAEKGGYRFKKIK